MHKEIFGRVIVRHINDKRKTTKRGREGKAAASTQASHADKGNKTKTSN